MQTLRPHQRKAVCSKVRLSFEGKDYDIQYVLWCPDLLGLSVQDFIVLTSCSGRIVAPSPEELCIADVRANGLHCVNVQRGFPQRCRRRGLCQEL